MLDPNFPTRSLNSDQATTVRFVNLSPFTAQVWWLDFESQPHLYATLSRGQSYVQETYNTHPWIVRDEHSGTPLAGIVGTDAAQTLEINTPTLKSSSGPAVNVRFKNSTHLEVDLYWIDYDGQEVFYATIQPGTHLLQSTYATHPWRIRTHGDNLELTAFIASEESDQVCEIENSLVGFENLTFLACDVFRIHPDGQEVRALALQPKESALAENVAALPWIVRDQHSGTKLAEGRSTTKPFSLNVSDRYVRSRDSNHAVSVRFANRNHFPVDLYWIDDQGQPKFYKTLASGEQYVQSTYAGHPWRIVEQYTQEQVAFFIPNAQAKQSFTIQMCSTRGEQETTVEFANESHLTADVLWIDYSGEEQHYQTLPPRAVYTQSTYVTHPWIVRDRHSGTVLATLIADRQPEVVRLSSKRLHSLPGGAAVNVLFENETSFPVDVFWIDASGAEVHYHTLAPAESYSQATYQHHPWLVRKKATGEEVFVFIPTADGEQTCEIRMASTSSDVPTRIEFTNRTLLTVDVYWIDFQGNEVHYASLAPHDHYVQQTYVTHPWVVKDKHSGEVLAVAVGKKQPQSLKVTAKHVRSLRGDRPVTITFTNTTPLTVDVNWIDYEGQQKLYRTLKPSESFQQGTYASHPWQVVAEGFGTPVGLFIPNDEPQQAFNIQNHLVRTQERPGGVLLEGEVALYEHKNYQGSVWILHSALSNFLLVQGLNDRISSVRVGPNTAVSLHQHVNFIGKSADIYMDTPDLQQTAIGDEALSSLNILRLVSPQSMGISSRSTLVEDYRLNARGQMETFSNYRTILSVPHSVKELDIWASQELVIEVAGQKYTIDPLKPARIKPNSLSKVLINIEAAALGLPTLEIRTNAMKHDERFLVFPDSDLHKKIANLPDGALYANRSQLGIQGEFDQTACDHVQQSIQNIARTVQYTYHPKPFGVHHKRQITAANMEHAHWSLDFGGGRPTYRPLSAGEVRSLTANARRIEDPLAQGFFDDIGHFFQKAGSVIVHTAENIGEDVVETGKHIVGDVVETAENVGKHVVQTVEHVGEDLVHGDVVDAFSDAGKGTLSVGQDLATGALHVGGDLVQGGVSIAGDVAKGAANLVVVTLKFAEEAVQFVLTHTGVVGEFIGKILEKIGSEAAKLIHWVMSKLGWDDILHTHDVLLDSFNRGLDRLKQWPEQLKQEEDQFFTALEDKISGDIDLALKKLGTYDSVKHAPQGPHHSDAVEKVEWLLSKFSEHETGNPIAALNPMWATGSDGPVSQFLDIAEGALGKDNGRLDAALEDAMSYVTAVFSDPHPTPALALSAILEVVKVVALAGLEIVNAIADALLDLIILVIDGFKSLMNQSWDIPFLSDLYSFITNGRQLSLVSFTSLLIAIPATLISKGLQGTAPFQTSGALALSLDNQDQKIKDWGYTYGAMHIIMVPVSIIADGYSFFSYVAESMWSGLDSNPAAKTASVDKYASAINYVNLGLGFLAQLAGCPIGYPDFNNPDFHNKDVAVRSPNYWAHVIWDYQWAGWLIAMFASVGINLVEAAHVKAKYTDRIGDVVKGFTTAWGIGHMALMSVLDLSDHAKADRITSLGQSVWNDGTKAVLLDLYRPDYTAERLRELETSIDRATPEQLQAFEQEVADYLNYAQWAYNTHIPQKTYGNIMDTFPEIGQLGAMPKVVEATEGLSFIGTAVFDLLGNLGEGITYVVRTEQNALL